MRSRKKEAKFFCESCGAEVAKNARVCSTCGKFFSSVRCPKCGRTGSNEDFSNGCPTCGYAVNPDSLGRSNSNIKYTNNLSSFLNGSKKAVNSSSKSSRFFSANKKRAPGRTNTDSSLPLWVYLVSLFVLGTLIIILYSCL